MSSTAPATRVYWRPGCGFCSSLRGSLDRYGIPHELDNIWESDDGAATVRSVANGNETVPTVIVGDIAMVNPTVHQVIAALEQVAPDQVPADYSAPQPGRVAKAIGRLLGD